MHGLHVDLVVLCVSADEFHPRNAGSILHFDNQAVLVPADIEHDAIIPTDARSTVIPQRR